MLLKSTKLATRSVLGNIARVLTFQVNNQHSQHGCSLKVRNSTLNGVVGEVHVSGKFQQTSYVGHQALRLNNSNCVHCLHRVTTPLGTSSWERVTWHDTSEIVVRQVNCPERQQRFDTKRQCSNQIVVKHNKLSLSGKALVNIHLHTRKHVGDGSIQLIVAEQDLPTDSTETGRQQKIARTCKNKIHKR